LLFKTWRITYSSDNPKFTASSGLASPEKKDNKDKIAPLHSAIFPNHHVALFYAKLFAFIEPIQKRTKKAEPLALCKLKRNAKHGSHHRASKHNLARRPGGQGWKCVANPHATHFS